MALALTFPITARAQWEIEESHTTASLRGIHNVGGGVAWASGTNGTVLRTEDGGYLWQTCAIPTGAEKLDFRGIQAFDENTAIVMSSGPGDQSRLYKTTDGCQTWKLLFTNPDKDGFWDALRFPDANSGFLLGDPVRGRFVELAIGDGGAKWVAVNSESLQAPNPKTGAFAASNSAMHDNSISFVTSGPDGAWLYQYESYCTMTIARIDPDYCNTSPSVNHYDRIKLPINGSSASSGAFSFESSNDGIVVVGGDYTKPDLASGTAAYYDSLFDKWFAAKTPPHGYRSSVAYDAAIKTWMTVGPNGTDISTDDGHNWRPLMPTPQDDKDADKNWNALSLPFVVGPHGRIGKLRANALPAPASVGTSTQKAKP